MKTQMYFLRFETPSADKDDYIVEATSPEEATQLAQAAAIEVGCLEADEISDPHAECFFWEPELIEESQGTLGIRW